MERKSYYLKNYQVSYIGNIKQSAKMYASFKNGVITYCIYLAPANMSGYEVCPVSQYCRNNCLNGSGRGKIAGLDALQHNIPFEQSRVNQARIKKTRWFFEDNETFTYSVLCEINRFMNYAKKNGYGFSVRLNGTSDLSPEDFIYQGKNILEWFPNVQFYDYTKVPARFALLKKYPNYDLTFSFNGYNWTVCKAILEKYNGKVAVVFHSSKMPKSFNGYKVVSGNEYDMRYLDPKKTIIGLHYHRTANDYDEKGKYIIPNTPFVVMENDERIIW